MKNVSPNNNQNAIKSVAFVFELDKEIDKTTIASIQEWYKTNNAFKHIFTVEQPIQSVNIQIDGNNQQVTSSNISGLNYIKFKKDGITAEWTLRIDARAITINCNLYTRWDEVWKLALNSLTEVVTQLNSFSLTKIALEYLDEFNVLDKSSNDWIGKLFKKNSPFIPSFVQDMNAPWHTHNGFITDEKDTAISRRTVNIVNITYQKIPAGHNDILTIQTQHASSFYNQLKLSLDSMQNINVVMEYNHLENKKLFNKLLSDEMLEEIKLKV